MSDFPLVNLIALIVGIIILITVKRKFKRIHAVELIIIFILYFLLVALFTEPGLNLARKFVYLIQL